MLGFSSLASAPLGADAARLLEVIAQGASSVAIAGTAEARTQIGAQSADIAAGLPLGGDAWVQAAVAGRGAAGLEVIGSAKALTKQAARLNADVRLSGNGDAEVRTGAAIRDGIDFIASAMSGVEGTCSANLMLEFQRFSAAESQIAVPVARSLPLVGSASAQLAAEATNTGLFASAGMARGGAGVVPQAIGDIDIGGAARAAVVAAITAAGQMALVGQGAMAGRASAGVVAALAIDGDAHAGLRTLGQAEPLVPVSGFGVSAVIAHGTGALPFATALHSEAATGLSSAADGGVSLSGQARLEVSVAAQAQPAQLVLTGNAAGTSLEPLEARGSGSLPVIGEGHAVGMLNAIGDGALATPGTSVTTGMVRAASAGWLGLARALEAELLVGGAVGRVIALAGTARVAARASVHGQDQRFTFEGTASAHTAGIGAALGGYDLAGHSEGMIATTGAAESTFAIMHAFTGEADVVGDSARLIGFSGALLARTGSTGKTSDSVVGLAGSAAARITAQADFAAGVALAGGTQISVAAAATSSGLIRWTTAASATAPRSAQSQGALSLAGAGMAQSAAMGTTTAAALAIDCALAGATGLAGDLRSDLPFEGTTGAMLDATARAAGQFDVARTSAADVQIEADAGRGMPLLGAAGGAAHVQAAGAISAARLEIMTEARGLTTADAASGSVFTAQGQVTGQASLNAESQGHVSVTRLGRGDILVAGTAARAMVFLGAAGARAITQAAANLPLEPGFAGAGNTVIRVAFQEQEAITGRGAALSMVQAAASGSEWELGAAAVAFRAPPALRRSEPPRMGLSGRLVPTNTGRILKG